MTQRYDLLPEAAQRLARVPRTGRLLARLPPATYDKLKSNTDVYWKVYTFQTRDGTGDCGLLADGLKVREARRLAWRRADEPAADDALFRRHQIRRAADLLGAIAFEMMATSTGPVDTIDEDYLTFQGRVCRRFLASRAFRDQDDEPEQNDDWGKDWNCLLAMDSHGLKHFIFSTDASDQQLRWTDVTTLAFFAAYWACRWANDNDRTLMRGWVTGIRNWSSTNPLAEINEGFREFWTFAAEMSDEAIKDNEGKFNGWKALFTPLYDGSLKDEEGKPIRSTEFIYRTWGRMKDTSAQKLFLSEFPQIVAGKQGSAKKKIADSLLAGFIALVMKPKACEGQISWISTDLPNDSGKFKMGVRWGTLREYEPEQDVVLSAYCLNTFCVTSCEYELFDPRANKASARESYPVVSISWYDACCFVLWLGRVKIDCAWYRIGLPTEAQWEYACLAGRQGTYMSSGGAQKQWRRAILPLTGLKQDGFQPNAWGFWQMDMYGIMWEWCWDGFYNLVGSLWDSPDVSAKAQMITFPVNAPPDSPRVVRGGSVIPAGLLQIKYRHGEMPRYRSGRHGLRLAAVPDLKRSPSKPD